MNSENNSRFSWTGTAKWLAAIVAIALSGGGGIATVNALIAFGEMRSEVRHNGDSLATLNEKLTEFGEMRNEVRQNGDSLATLNERLTEFGEMKSEVRQNGDSLATLNERLTEFGEMKSEVRQNRDSLATLNERLTEFGMSQTRMEGNMQMIIRFIMEDKKGGDSASLNRDESETSVPAGMAVHCG